MAAKESLVIYTDGGCRGNPGLGAWAAVLRSGEDTHEIAGVVEETTNNRMELLAAISGLEELKRSCRVRVVTDSQYVFKGMTQWVKGWIRKGWVNSSKEPVKNKDLWERLLEASSHHDVEWEWVRGHDGHEYNERCDELVNQAMDAHELS